MEPGPFLLGFDIGSSSVKVSVVESATGLVKASASSPASEMEISSPHPGWAEQAPEMWWHHAVLATRKALHTSGIAGKAIEAIGISYQMHGLVLLNKKNEVLRPSIIWCDSRAVEIGEKALRALGEDYCLRHLLNSPGNFTASKLRWVKEHEPSLFKDIHKMMLPGDYLAWRLTGEITTTVSGLSEGIFWDFQERKISAALLNQYDLTEQLIPTVLPNFGHQGTLTQVAAHELGLQAGIEISYRAGDQPNNAFSLKVLQPGEVAATAGTSGVIYGVVNKPTFDSASRVNTFVHVNSTKEDERLGVLLCVNGTGSMNSWLRKNWSGEKQITYQQLNQYAASVPIGADGLRVLPFGNGAERMLGNKSIGASFLGINLTRHSEAHISRAVQEGIVCALGYGFDILRQIGVGASVIRAGRANMFLSDLFCEAFTNVTGAQLELYNTDGAQGAARAAGLGKGIYTSAEAAFAGLQCVAQFEPSEQKQALYQEVFKDWKIKLQQQLN